jgi:hypothetical protein
MIKVNFTPKTDIEEYINNDFNLEIFEDLTENEDWQEKFEPLEFLNLLYEQFEIVNANKEKPLSVVKHLLGLKLEQTKLYYLLYYLIRHIYKHSCSEYEPKDKQLSICRGFIEKEYDKLEAELYPKTETEPQPEKENKYNFNKVKQHIETLATVKDKILYLTERQTDFLQNKSGWDLDIGTPFDQKCELEIKKMKALSDLESAPTQTKQAFQLRKKHGAKVDLIRILNAVYELKYFEMTNGQIPSKELFMKQVGEFFGIDLSKYDTDLSQALNNTSLEANFNVFEEMKRVTQKSHYIGKNEK